MRSGTTPAAMAQMCTNETTTAKIKAKEVGTGRHVCRESTNRKTGNKLEGARIIGHVSLLLLSDG